MTVFEHKLWGYELTYPDDWMHKAASDLEAFAPYSESLKPAYEGPRLGHLMVRGEFNPQMQPIDTLWNRHIAKLSVMLNAKKLGSAPLQFGGGTGYEVEIVLPKKDKKRLWVGILSYKTTILHLMVLHLKENRTWFEPLASKIVASIRFLEWVNDIEVNRLGIPLPPDYVPTDPLKLIPDISNPESWEGYDGSSDTGALQNFYLRELPVHGWDVIEYSPFPGSEEVNFARLRIHRDSTLATIGILPTEEKHPTGKIMIKYDRTV